MKHLIIDCNNLYYRANYVTNLRDRKGKRISGIFNTMKMLQGLIKKFQPSNLIIVWDGGRSKERLEVYSEYKANRRVNQKEDDKIDLINQRDIIKEIFSHLPIKQLEIKNLEADDVIGYLSRILKGKKVIISNDNDFLQLIKKDVYLYLPYKDKLLSEKNIEMFLGFPVKYYVLWKCLVGDSSDNIKGIKGIGPKKANAIIINKSKYKKKLPINSEELEILNRNKYLISIGALLDDGYKDIIRNKYISEKYKTDFNYNKVEMIFKKLRFKTLLYDFDYYWIYNFKKIRKSFYGKKNKEYKKEKIGSG